MGKMVMSRRNLFELVWAKPMTQLARQFGVPAKHLARACDRHDVPRPHPGHWQKQAHGKKLRMVELPVEYFRVDALVIIGEILHGANAVRSPRLTVEHEHRAEAQVPHKTAIGRDRRNALPAASLGARDALHRD